MTGRQIGLAAQCVPGLSPEETVRVAAAAGFDLVGVTIDPDSWSAKRAAEVRRIAAGEGIRLHDAEVIRLSRPDDPAHARLIDHAAAAGIAHVIVIGLMADRAALIDAVARLAAHARDAGVQAVLEFGAFTDVPGLPDALAIADAVPGLAVLVDPLHLARSGGVPDDVASVPVERMPYVQWCDGGAPLPAPDRADLLEEARARRLDVGGGTLPLSDLLTVLPPGMPLMTKVRSTAIAARFPDPVAHARHLHASLAGWLHAQGGLP
ncbi:sugar phosphate isomerase/epimerase [Sphingomonas jejuensis]|uniref:Sugar phosphate isomerase/epimerase n=1 Tax=Sphingomonas jejuensis TaxID=904715 RepID=A0ABX0XKU7_9SPHN|nr:sugar phosphate isomerase/epimerase [Sphingomonas jejuensis]